jgi:ParB-like chromosome segregation protein Spo0J
MSNGMTRAVELDLAAGPRETHARLRLHVADAQREMERSLSRHGQLTPVVVSRTAEGLELLDGFKRVRAARALGWAVMRGELSEVAGPGAKLLLWQCNAGGSLSELEQGWLVQALYREDGLTQPQISHLLGRHKSWVSRRLMLVEGLSDEVQASVRLGLLSATAARELGQLPRGNQDEAAQVVMRRGLTTRQATGLVTRLSSAENELSRARVLEDAMTWTPERPRVGQRADERRQRTPGELLVTDVAAVSRLSIRLHARLLEKPFTALGESAAEAASHKLKELRPGLLSLCQTIERVTAEKVERRVG